MGDAFRFAGSVPRVTWQSGANGQDASDGVGRGDDNERGDS